MSSNMSESLSTLVTAANSISDAIQEKGLRYQGLVKVGDQIRSLMGETDLQQFLTKEEAEQQYLKLSGGTVTGNVSVTGKLDAQTVNITSDRRLKENITPIDISLPTLQLYTYNFKGESKKRIGLIAQEVQEVLPEAVHENVNGTLSIDYSTITAILLQEIFKLKKQIEDLKR